MAVCIIVQNSTSKIKYLFYLFGIHSSNPHRFYYCLSGSLPAAHANTKSYVPLAFGIGTLL